MKRCVIFQSSSDGAARPFSTLEEVVELFKKPGQGLPHELKEPIINELNNVIDLDHDTGWGHFSAKLTLRYCCDGK